MNTWIERPRDAQTVLDSRPIGFHGIASREEGTKRKREEKKEDELGSQASRQSQAFDRGWRFVAGRKSDLSGNLSRDTKFKSQNVFRGRESEWEKVKEREREREGGRLCPRAVGDSKSGSAIISEGESEIRSSNRISRGQTLSVTKPASILGYRWPFNVSNPGSKETLALICKISRHRALVSFRIHSRLIGSWWKRQELFKLVRRTERCLGWTKDLNESVIRGTYIR